MMLIGAERLEQLKSLRILCEVQILARNEQKFINVESIAAAEAAKILCNPEWKTRTSY